MTTLTSTGYRIYIGTDSFKALTSFIKKRGYSNYIIICDENTLSHCLPLLLSACPHLHGAEIMELESGEAHKTLETCTQMWGALTDIRADKKSLVINLGGGVISDMGGFVASTFKRGVDFINIPTTLLAMVDASVGGKTGVDFDGIKNHIGTITNPKAVIINPLFLETLSERQLKNGYAEVIKIALMADAAFWNDLQASNTRPHFYSEALMTNAIALKNTIVTKDLHEDGLRKSLNFGHSIGHALESALLQQQKEVLHGEAIAAGMVMESWIAYQKNYLTLSEYRGICNYIHSIYPKIPINTRTANLLLNYIRHDKKNERGALCFALPKHIGNYASCSDISLENIKTAIHHYVNN